MIFYLGHNVTSEVVTEKLRIAKNKAKKWEYGYDEDIDTVIISKDGTLGEVYKVMGLNIGFPQKPDDKEIINHDKISTHQKWERQEEPEGLNSSTMHLSKYQSYIDQEFDRRYYGVWVYIKGFPVWIPGTYYLGIQHIRENKSYPSFRIIQNELMIFWEACKADQRCYGMDYVKNRRFGASFLGIIEQIDAGTLAEDKVLGMISKKGTDVKKIFRRLIKCFKRLPCYFLPLWDGTTTPKTELVLDEPTKRKKAGEVVSEGEGLGTIISWHNTEINAMDGEEIFRSLIDEAGKYPKEVPFSEYWYIVKTSHRIGSDIVGKSMVVSTVNSKNKGGGEFKKIWDDSDIEKRNQNGQTKSGLYRIFIDAALCLQGFFDEYGFSIVQDPVEPIKNENGKVISIGADTYLKNEVAALANDPEKQNEFLRQFPRKVKDAFRDESNDCAFNVTKISEQIEYNDEELEDQFNTNDNEFVGNNDLERGNLTWKNGIPDTEVVWRPDPENGRFFIKKGCFPPKEFRNKFVEKTINGVKSKTPIAGHIGTIGIDPYNRSKTADGRGSKGSAHLVTKYHTCDELPKETCIVEYIARPRKIEIFFDEMIMLARFYSVPFLIELSNERFLALIKDRGYRNFSMNNPFKLYKDLNPTEKEFGGAPAQDSKTGEAQFQAVESFVEDHIGVARDNSNRMQGDMGDFPFTRTLEQLKDVDPEKRTKYDAYISFSLALLGNQKRIFKKEESTQTVEFNPFQDYDNSGTMSKAI